MKKKQIQLAKKLVIRKEQLGSLEREKQNALKGGALNTMDENANQCHTWWGWCWTWPGVGRTCMNPCRW